MVCLWVEDGFLGFLDLVKGVETVSIGVQIFQIWAEKFGVRLGRRAGLP